MNIGDDKEKVAGMNQGHEVIFPEIFPPGMFKVVQVDGVVDMPVRIELISAYLDECGMFVTCFQA
jgi:hypothetical protein